MKKQKNLKKFVIFYSNIIVFGVSVLYPIIWRLKESIIKDNYKKMIKLVS